MMKTRKNKVSGNLLLFFIWPLASVYNAVKGIKYLESRFIYVFFYFLFGFLYIVDPNADRDSSRYYRYFHDAEERPFSDFYEVVLNVYTSEDLKPDVLMSFLNYSVSRFTDNFNIFYGILGILIGYLFVMNIRLQADVYKKRNSSIAFLFLIFLYSLMPIYSTISFRNNLALMIFSFGFYKFAVENKKLGLLICGTTVFVHFGFFFALALLAIYFFIGNKNKLFYGFIFLSFFLNVLASNFIGGLGDNVSDGLSKEISGYNNEDYLSLVGEIKTHRLYFLDKYIYWTSLFFTTVLIFFNFTKHYKNDKGLQNLFSFCLILFAFVNFTRDIESISNRFAILHQFLSCFLLIRLFSLYNLERLKNFKAVAILALIGHLIITTRISFDHINASLFLPFFPLNVVFDLHQNIIDLIK